MEKFIVYNAIRTPDKTVLESRHRHDFVTHIDANGEYYQNDGGIDEEYLQAIIDYEELNIPQNKYLPIYCAEKEWRQNQ